MHFLTDIFLSNLSCLDTGEDQMCPYKGIWNLIEITHKDTKKKKEKKCQRKLTIQEFISHCDPPSYRESCSGVTDFGRWIDCYKFLFPSSNVNVSSINSDKKKIPNQIFTCFIACNWSLLYDFTSENYGLEHLNGDFSQRHPHARFPCLQ